MDDGTTDAAGAPGGAAGLSDAEPGPSRAERRRSAEAEAKLARGNASPWRAWWAYPLLALVVVCSYFGYQSASEAPAPTPPVVEVSEAP